MFDPPRGAGGLITPYDEPLLKAEDGLIRHINPAEHVVPDENSGSRRISSAAFSATTGDPDHGMSVDLEPSLAAAGLPPDAMVNEGWGAVSIGVGDIRALKLMVGADPVLPENKDGLPANPHHGQVWGVKGKSQRRQIHRTVRAWVRPLPGVGLR